MSFIKIGNIILILSASPSHDNHGMRRQLGWLDETAGDSVVAGGYHPTLAPENYCASGVDIVSRGEGEFSLRDLINGFDRTGRFNTSNGFWFKQPDGTVIRNKCPSRI